MSNSICESLSFTFILMQISEINSGEVVLRHKDIDFSNHTINKLTDGLLAHIEIAATAICETSSSLKQAIDSGQIKIGGYESICGRQWVYIKLKKHSYVIPYIVMH